METTLSIRELIVAIDYDTKLVMEYHNSGFVMIVRKNFDHYTLECVNNQTMIHINADELILRLYYNWNDMKYTLITETKQEIIINK